MSTAHDSTQPGLFDDDPQPAHRRGLVLSISASRTGTLNKAQQAFNRAIAKVTKLRAELAMWHEYALRYERRVNGHVVPLLNELRDCQVAMLQVIDKLLDDKAPNTRLSKSQRKASIAMLVDIAQDVLGGGEHPQAEALHDKYHGISHRARRRAEIADAQAMFSHVLGEDIRGSKDAETLEELLARTAEKAAQQAQDFAQAQQQRSAGNKDKGKHKATRAEAAEARREQAAKEASQSVRDVYRKLAALLHPDREQDAAERVRKTALMQRVNEAYAHEDLLALLTMQLEVEQIDEQHLAALSDTRLKHYNDVLREQQLSLEAEIAECTAPMRMALGLTRYSRLSDPAPVERSLDAEIAQLRATIEEVQHDAQVLINPATRTTLLMQWVQSRRQAEVDSANIEADVLHAMLSVTLDAGAMPKRRRRGKARKR